MYDRFYTQITQGRVPDQDLPLQLYDGQPLPEKSLVTKIARVGQARKQELLFWGEARTGHPPCACSAQDASALHSDAAGIFQKGFKIKINSIVIISLYAFHCFRITFKKKNTCSYHTQRCVTKFSAWNLGVSGFSERHKSGSQAGGGCCLQPVGETSG